MGIDAGPRRQPIRVLVVSDVRLYREGIAAALDRREAICVAGAVGGAESLSLATRLDVAVIVVDIATEDCLATIRALAGETSCARIVAFAVDENSVDIPSYAEAGIAGYVSSDATVEELAATVESVTHGEAFSSPKVTAALFRRIASLAMEGRAAANVPPLSRREEEVLSLIRRGLSNKEIANHLTIELTTVKNHVHSLLRKLQVGSRAEAATIYKRSEPRSRIATI
jgi:DNA-binding NarL/FixJ family response regulator